MNAAVPWTPPATPTPSTASTISAYATPMSSTSSQLSTASAPSAQSQAVNAWAARLAEMERQRLGQQRGGAPRPIPDGATCVFPTASEREGTEPREFEEGELVCVQHESGTTKELAVYLRTEGSQHIVKTGDADTLAVIWWRVGKYRAPTPSWMSWLSGTGAAGQGVGTGTVSFPYLFSSSPYGQGGPPTHPDGSLSMLGKSGGKGRSQRRKPKRKSKARVTRRR